MDRRDFLRVIPGLGLVAAFPLAAPNEELVVFFLGVELSSHGGSSVLTIRGVKEGRLFTRKALVPRGIEPSQLWWTHGDEVHLSFFAASLALAA